ncbi:MAG: nucleotidyltransferase domain-containing protein [Elusimicrobiota bacterium]
MDVIQTKYSPEKIILYGSAAYGKMKKDSDIDMLIIKKVSVSLTKRMQEVYKLLINTNYKVPFEPLVFTPEEIEERISLGDPFLKEVLEKGKVIYDRKNI